MVAAQLNCGGASVSSGLTNRRTGNRTFPCQNSTSFPTFLEKPRNCYVGRVRKCSLFLDRAKGFINHPVVRQRKHVFSTFNHHLSSICHAKKAHDVEEKSTNDQQDYISSVATEGLDQVNGIVSYKINDDKLEEVPTSTSPSKINDDMLEEVSTSTSQSKDVRRELIMLSLPAIGGQVIEPMVQLMETAYIGRMGSVELASASVSISLFNIVSKLFNIPLLSVATSFVAEDISKNASSTSGDRLQLSSVSTALLLAVGIGIFEAGALSLGSGPLLSIMGISPASPMRAPAQQFLLLRALGAPAFVVSLALQGIFRGFKDTKTPVFCLGFGNLTAAFLFPFFMNFCKLGVHGAAISTVVSQYIVTFSMIWYLSKRAVLLPPKLGELQFGGYLKSGGFLIGRTLAVLLTMTLATSMAARQGPTAMAAHQICMQVWLAVSLLTDALATSAQALISSYISKDDYKTVRNITRFVLKIGVVTGITLAILLGVSFSSLAPIFTKDAEVLAVVKTGILFVSASQPLNALAFIVDGLHYGVSDFPYAARSAMLVGAISSAFLLYAPKVFGLPGVWSGLTLFMGLRMAAGIVRLLDQNGPWWFLHRNVEDGKLVG